MALEIVYDTKEAIPEGYADLYTEKDDKFHLTGINGMVSKVDVDSLNTALGKERTEHKATKEKYRPFAEVDHDKYVTEQSELEELRAYKIAADDGDTKGAEKFEAKVEATVKSRMATLEAKSGKTITDLEKTNGEQSERIVSFERAETNRTISDSVRKASLESKVIDTAVEDILILGERVFEVTEENLVLTKDGVGVTPGIAPDVWLSEMQDKRPHWWPTSEGGGAKGGKGASGFSNNPFTAAHWNLTLQGQAYKADPDKATRMATAAGTKIGGMKPAAQK